MSDTEFQIRVGADVSEVEKKVGSLKKLLKELQDSYDVFNKGIQEGYITDPSRHKLNVKNLGLVTINQLAKRINEVIDQIAIGERRIIENASNTLRDKFVKDIKLIDDAKKKLNELKSLGLGKSEEADDLRKTIKAAQSRQRRIMNRAEKSDNKALLTELNAIEAAHKKELLNTSRLSAADTKARQTKIDLQKKEKAAQEAINKDLKEYVQVTKEIKRLERELSITPNMSERDEKAFLKLWDDNHARKAELEKRLAGNEKFVNLQNSLLKQNEHDSLYDGLKKSREISEQEVASFKKNLKEQENNVKQLAVLRRVGEGDSALATELKQNVARLSRENNSYLQNAGGKYLDDMNVANAAHRNKLYQWKANDDIKSSIEAKKNATSEYISSLKEQARLKKELSDLRKDGYGNSEYANHLRGELLRNRQYRATLLPHADDDEIRNAKREYVYNVKRDSYSNKVKEEKQASKEALSNAISSYSSLYKEREGIVKGLGKLSDASTKYATNAKNRLKAIDAEMDSLVDKWGDNKEFSSNKSSLEGKTASANIMSGLKEQYSDQAKSLSSMMTEVKTKIGHLELRRLKGTWTNDDYADLRKLVKEYRDLEKALKAVNKQTGMSGLAKFNASIKGHLYWMISGDLVDRLRQLPNYIKHTTVEFDNLRRKILQNIEMTEQFAGKHKELEEASFDLVHRSLDLANVYGMKTKDVLDMMQIMSRRFKDPDELAYYTNLAVVMSKLDFVTPAVAAETLESIVLSFGLSAQEASKFVDEFTVATHTMRINGQDLLEAFKRSGPMLKAWGLNTAEAVALISTASTTLGREGTYLGTAFNGMFARTLNAQNIKALESVGISFTKANGEAKTGIEMLREYWGRYKDLSEEAKREEVKYIFGAHRYAIAETVLANWGLFEETLSNIEKSATKLNTLNVLKVQLDSYESQLNRIDNAFTILAYAIGEGVMPPFTGFLESIALSISELVKLNHGLAGCIAIILQAVIAIGSLNSAVKICGKLLGTDATLLSALTRGLIVFNKSAVDAAGGVNKISFSLTQAMTRLIKTTFYIWAMYQAFQAVKALYENSYYKKNIDKDERKQIRNKLFNQGRLHKDDLLGAAFIEYDVLSRDIERRQEKVDRFLAVQGTEAEQYVEPVSQEEIEQLEKDKQRLDEVVKPNYEIADSIDRAQQVEKMVEEKTKRVHGFNTDTVTDDEKEKNGGSGSKNYSEYTRNQKNTKAKELKTEYDNSKTRYKNDLEGLDFDDELYGKSVSSFINRNRLKSNRKNYLFAYQDKVDAEIEAINKELEGLSDKKDEEKITRDGRETTVGELKSVLSEANNKLKTLSTDISDEILEINRELRKAYTVPYEEQVKQEQQRNETSKKIRQLKADNKRNAWNYMTQNNIELEHEIKNNEILYKDYQKSIKDRMKLEEELRVLKELNAESIAKLGYSQYLDDIKQIETRLQETKDAEQEKYLAVEESNKKIEDLEKKKTEKIREGLHGIVQDLLLEGKSLKDIWNKLWTDLAEEALRALMRIEGGQQSTLGALAANLGGLDGGGGKGGGKAKAGASAVKGKGGKAKAASVAASVYGGNTLGLEYAGGWISHDGSIIGVTPLNTRYYHNGGNVGTSVVPYLKSDEVNAVLQTGEEVVSRKDRRSNELMSEQNKHMADAMQRMAEGSNTNVTFAIQAIDSKSVVQLLSENGDAIMNILRKQSAYGNGRI